jgi:hypothetical protein
MLGTSKKKKKRKISVKELDAKVRELKKKNVLKGDVHKSVKDEDFDQYIEDLWAEKLHEEEKEKEDAFTPEGLVLKSGQEVPQKLEESVRRSPSFDSENTPEGDRGGGDLYNSGKGEGDLYGAESPGESLYDPTSALEGSSDKMYSGNIGIGQDQDSDDRKTEFGGLESSEPGSLGKKSVREGLL